MNWSDIGRLKKVPVYLSRTKNGTVIRDKNGSYGHEIPAYRIIYDHSNEQQELIVEY